MPGGITPGGGRDAGWRPWHTTRRGADFGLEGTLLAGDDRQAVETSRQFALALGVSSTPTVVIGNQGYTGVRSWAEVRSLIDERLEETR